MVSIIISMKNAAHWTSQVNKNCVQH
jgi:hypothetical protein